jgi:hypothetical protein
LRPLRLAAIALGVLPLVLAAATNYARQYPLTFAGTYRVTWKLAGSALGPALRFRLPVS